MSDIEKDLNVQIIEAITNQDLNKIIDLFKSGVSLGGAENMVIDALINTNNEEMTKYLLNNHKITEESLVSYYDAELNDDNFAMNKIKDVGVRILLKRGLSEIHKRIKELKLEEKLEKLNKKRQIEKDLEYASLNDNVSHLDEKEKEKDYLDELLKVNHFNLRDVIFDPYSYNNLLKGTIESLISVLDLSDEIEQQKTLRNLLNPIFSHKDINIDKKETFVNDLFLNLDQEKIEKLGNVFLKYLDSNKDLDLDLNLVLIRTIKDKLESFKFEAEPVDTEKFKFNLKRPIVESVKKATNLNELILKPTPFDNIFKDGKK